jgi:hypothetical protein
MQVFHRQGYSEIWITLQSNETLGILDSGYLEDYFGVNNQLTLYNPLEDTRVPILMAEIPEVTPSIANDVFQGVIDLTTTPNGIYRVEGRVKDVFDHYTILSEVESPLGGENVVLFEIKITATEIILIFPEVIPIVEGVSFSIGLSPELEIPSELSKTSVLPSPVVEYVVVESLMDKGVLVSTELVEGVFFNAPLNDTNLNG